MPVNAVADATESFNTPSHDGSDGEGALDLEFGLAPSSNENCFTPRNISFCLKDVDVKHEISKLH